MPYYGIYEINNGKLEVYRLVDGFYQMLAANERGHYPIAPLGVELGLWQGSYLNQTQLWLRWWDEQGNLLLIGDERAELERQRAEQPKQERVAEAQARRNAIPRLLGMGGVALVTFGGISQISNDDWGDYWYWGFTTLSARRLFEEVFPATNVKVETYGNVLAATAFLHGLAVEELRP